MMCTIAALRHGRTTLRKRGGGTRRLPLWRRHGGGGGCGGGPRNKLKEETKEEEEEDEEEEEVQAATTCGNDGRGGTGARPARKWTSCSSSACRGCSEPSDGTFDAELYTHRTGRAGRVGGGAAASLLSRDPRPRPPLLRFLLPR